MRASFMKNAGDSEYLVLEKLIRVDFVFEMVGEQLHVDIDDGDGFADGILGVFDILFLLVFGELSWESPSPATANDGPVLDRKEA